MKKHTEPRKQRIALFLNLQQGIFRFATVLMTFGYTGMQAQCPAPLTVTGSTTAGATGTWTAPASGGPWLVQITATGAGGGANTGNTGGSGATISATFLVNDGVSLLAIAGGAGEANANNGGGGGGGSGVVNCGNPSNCATGTILMIAAGGNGAEGGNNGLGGSATTGGTGNGGPSNNNANSGGGGGGLNSPGGNGTGGTGGSQVSKTGLSTGGDGTGGGGDPDGGGGMGGGGGGGSSATDGSGGGAGHTGVTGGNTASATSYLDASGSLQFSSDGATGGGSNAGSVTILCLGTQSQQGQCNNTTVINLSGPGVQAWKAPATGGPWSVQITATGGGGGNSEGPNEGGGGASITSTFTVQNNQVLFAIAGGAGVGSATNAGGGGGGSGVVNCGTSAICSSGTVMIIAAGGNGGENDGDGQGGLDDAGTPPGDGGNSSSGASDGGGGGGSNSNGSGTTNRGGGKVSLTGLSTGGDGTGTGTDPDGGGGMGGGGGGGSSNSSGSGGGGGYEGGDAGNSATAANKPRSFNSGTLVSSNDGATGAGPSGGVVTIVCLASLPVELINFKALIRDNQTVDLRWSTASEKNNHGYDIERSADNRHWSTLGFAPGNGTTVEQHDYAFSDEKPLTGINYYRLKQVDFDGKFEYSPMVVADVRANGLQFDVFPNPSASGELNIRTVSQTEGDAQLEIYDWAGYKVYKETIQLLKGTMVYPVSLATYPKGTYTARLEMPGGAVHFRKIVLQ